MKDTREPLYVSLNLNSGEKLSALDPAIYMFVLRFTGYVIPKDRRQCKDGKASFEKRARPMYEFGEMMFIKEAKIWET